MSFRGKIFCSVVVPAVALVVVVAAVLFNIVQRQLEDRAAQDAQRVKIGFDQALRREFRTLGEMAAPFQSGAVRPYFDALIEGAIGFDEFQVKLLDFQGVAVSTPPLCTWADAEGKVYLRQVLTNVENREYENHPCAEGCRHPESEFVEQGRGDGLIVMENRSLMAAWVEPVGEGVVLVAKPIEADLQALAASSGVELVVQQGDRIVFSTIKDVTPAMLQVGREILSDRKTYRVTRLPSLDGVSVLVPLVDVSALGAIRDNIFKWTIVMIAGAFVLALAVSMGVSRTMSRPVLELEAASRKVGEGDLEVQVTVRSRDEVGHLGRSFNDMVQNIKKRHGIMQKTLSAEVETKMMKEKELTLGGSKQMVSIMFLDVRGFTSMTEGMDAGKAMELVNQTMTRVEGCIKKHHGMVNKYLGDGCMALFGAPESTERDALNSIEAARAIQAEMKLWNETRKANHEPPIQVGIGINTDEVLAGYAGSLERLEFTVIGEGVNLASRLCSKALPGQILVSYVTRRDSKQDGKELEPVHVKGFSMPIRVYEV